MGNAEIQVRQLFEDFKRLHPNAIDTYEPTVENVRRWHWAVNEAIGRNEKAKDEQAFGLPDDRDARILARSRAVGTFSRFQPMTKDRFLTLASLFPGRRVYATGSRLTGEYIDKDSPGKIQKMRAALLKADKVESDYDVTLDWMADDKFDDFKKLMPEWGDLVMNVPKGEPKIEIPMWDFSKLPVDLHAVVVDLVERKQWGQLMNIHNEYRLSDVTFCCDSKPAERWFTWAVANGVIKKQTDVEPKSTA